MYLKIKQPLTAPTFNGEERGLPLNGADFVRIIVHTPPGQTFAAPFSVRLALRHGATGLLFPLHENSTIQSGAVTGWRSLVVAEIPVHGNEGDELVACVVGATTQGTPLDVEWDTGFIHLVLEALPAS